MSRQPATVPTPPANHHDKDRPMDRPITKDALEREIEHTREELVQTVDAIVERVDPSLVAQRTTEQVKRTTARTAEDLQTRAEDVVQEVREFADREPVLAKVIAAAAAGVALLMIWNEVRPIKVREGRS